jgi:aminoglycoside 6'-N-acetyltransferase I
MSGRLGLEIRSAQPSDAPFLAEFLAGAGHYVVAAELARRLEAVRAAPGAALLAQDWGPPIGLIVMAWSQSLLAARPAALVTTLVVDPGARRRGIGRALLKAASQAARQAGCGEVRLLVPGPSADLVGFATATGFDIEGALLTRSLRKAGGRAADHG